MSFPVFPTCLRTRTATEGRSLARTLAERAIAERATSTHAHEGRVVRPEVPPLEALAAAYFQAVAAVNSGWR